MSTKKAGESETEPAGSEGNDQKHSKRKRKSRSEERVRRKNARDSSS